MTKLTRWLGSLIFAFSLVLVGCSDSGETEQEAASTSSSSSSSSSSQSAEPAEKAEPVTWRFALEEIEGSVQDAYAQEFKRQIEDMSDGQIEIEIYPYGALGTSSQLTELVQDGSIQLAFASPGHLASVIPEVGVFTLHFVLSDDNDVNKEVLSSSKVHNLFDSPYAEQNMQLLGIVPEGWMVWTGNKPLRTPADFSEFKMRTMTSPILTESYKAYGANPSPMPYSEVYSGLQLKQIDGQVNPIFAIEEMSFYEVQEAMTLANHAQFITTLVSNKEWYESLPDDQRKWLDDTRAELVDYIYQKQAEFNGERLEKITQNSDIEVVELTDEQRAVFRDASMGVRDIYLEAAGERGQEILDTITSMVEEADSGEM
ncbi:TRAP transporter substrate-binding protein DctP [Marinobacter xestospongiae]|uniref:TRAP transporter substrate-binding protein n=1 Tax=Marinobacter xestospongiae TaxID=994319 RepID=UPI00200394EF|nr:TRAP transporter substrate-binding protein DctP [Marinobacter xestospongiae]MCK7565368.1 TRAP transporter substrate-binding protein DctP [Marinobacter xestospongiae]